MQDTLPRKSTSHIIAYIISTFLQLNIVHSPLFSSVQDLKPVCLCSSSVNKSGQQQIVVLRSLIEHGRFEEGSHDEFVSSHLIGQLLRIVLTFSISLERLGHPGLTMGYLYICFADFFRR